MNRGVMINDAKESIARAIWEGNAIMGTDGLVKNSTATYAFVISMSQANVNTNVKGGGFLPPTPQYTDPYSKRNEAAALLAGLQWVQLLLAQHPNQTDSDPLPLLIPIDNDSVIKDVHQRINNQSPTFARLSPEYDIMQAIHTIILALPFPIDIFHVKGHQDNNKHWSELDPSAQINVLADRQANAIYQKLPDRTGLFPTWVPGMKCAKCLSVKRLR
jgi:hypothetical protein